MESHPEIPQNQGLLYGIIPNFQWLRTNFIFVSAQISDTIGAWKKKEKEIGACDPGPSDLSEESNPIRSEAYNMDRHY